MRLQTLEILLKAENIITIEGTVRARVGGPLRILKGRRKNISTLTELCRIFNIDYGDIVEGILRFTKQTVADNHLLSSDQTEQGLLRLPVERFIDTEIPVADFQETDVIQIHRAHSTGTMAFRSCGSRNDLVWIQAGGEDSYRNLRGRGWHKCSHFSR